MIVLKKLSYIHWLRASLSSLLCVLVLAIIVNVVIDPFFQYHKPLNDLSYAYEDVMYQSAGIIKNFDYETLIVGSSLIQNMRPSYVEKKLGTKAIKIPLCGMSFSYILQACNIALNYNPKLKIIIMNIDPTVLYNDNIDTSFPEYLYDDNIFNDINYLLNKNVLLEKNMKIINRTIHGEKEETLDEAFSSEKTFYFSEYSAIQSFSLQPIDYNEKELQQLYEQSVEQLLNLVNNNSKVKFYFVIPPKSILDLYTMNLNGYLDFYCDLITETFEIFERFDNCTFFMFQDEIEIISNLYNYCDTQHFSSVVSDKIVFDIANGNNELTKVNYRSRIANIKSITQNFDYSIFSSNNIPLKDCGDLNDYKDLLKDNRYVYAVKYVGTSASSNISEGVYCAGEKYVSDEITFDFSDDNTIKKDGVVYSYGLEGINYVVYDRKLGRIIDSVRFDFTTGKAYERLSNRKKDTDKKGS